MRRTGSHRAAIVLALALGALCGAWRDAAAGGRVGLYGLRIVPNNDAARQVSEANWGGGLFVAAPLGDARRLAAFSGGVEIISFMSRTVSLQDRTTGLLVDQRTYQMLYRPFVGIEVGPHNDRAFFRPHAAAHVSLNIYNISTDLIIPNDSGEDVTQNLGSRTSTVFGYDFTLGADLNFNNRWGVEGGVRYLKTFSLPQQLGNGSERIWPDYIQAYFGVSISFASVEKASQEPDEVQE